MKYPIQKFMVFYWKVGTMASLLFLCLVNSRWMHSKLHTDVRRENTRDRYFKTDVSATESSLESAFQFANSERQESFEGVKDSRRQSWVNPSYVWLPPPETGVVFGSPGSYARPYITSSETTDDPITEYFKTLRKPTGFCKKLVRLGGSLKCLPNITSPVMDGHKIICLDPEFQIGSTLTNTTDCLVLSFGIGPDESFDEAIREANCEVHMFDTLSLNPPLAREDKFVHFHKFGLGTGRTIIHVKSIGMTVNVDSYSNIIYDLGLNQRLVNVLKMDIEAAEWNVLENMLLGNFLDTIGQIAMEVHAFEFATFKNIYQMSEYKRFLEILKRLEERGFRRVSYWDNMASNMKKRIQTKMQSFVHAGELLLVNTNWYNKEFRRQGKLSGYNFINF